MDPASIVLLICAIAMFLLVILTPVLICIYVIRWMANAAKKSYRSIRK